jgi:hypothetical protein
VRFSRAILISLAVTVALTAILMVFFGPYALGLFLFFPLSFTFGKKKNGEPPHHNEPLEPK